MVLSVKPRLKSNARYEHTAKRESTTSKRTPKMFQNKRNLAKLGIIVFLLNQHLTLLESKALCPIGFRVAYDINEDPVCFRKKGPETFADKFVNCTGNRFTMKRLRSLNITPSDQTIWTDYKNMYEGGPFVDWSYTKESGNPLDSRVHAVKLDSMYNVNEKLCVVIDPVINFTAVACDEKHYRYCFVYSYDDPMIDGYEKECDSLKNFDPDPPVTLTDSEEMKRSTYGFLSPMPTCIMQVVPKQGGLMGTTWRESQQACVARGGSLLKRSWRYLNYPIFSSNSNASFKYPIYPYAVSADAGLTLPLYHVDRDNASIPEPPPECWGPFKSYNFSHVICEKTIPLMHVNLSVSIDDNDKDSIVLSVDNQSLRKSYIRCFTDSASYILKKVSIKSHKKKDFILKVIGDGYYWCDHMNYQMFYLSESNRLLHVKIKNETENIYAVKVTALAYDYNLTDIGSLVQNDWKKKIETCMSYRTQFGPINNLYNDYMRRKNQSDWSGFIVLRAKVKIKRVYLNTRSALLHVTLHKNMLPVDQGQWDDIRIDYMRPAYFCEQKDPIPKRLALGESKKASACTIYTCIGNFNEGVQIKQTQANDTSCTPNLSTTIGVDNFTTTTEVGKLMSTTPQGLVKTPQQQLQQVMNQFNSLFNKTESILVADIESPLDKVDGFLAATDDLGTPGDLLHLLDNLGAKIELNGTSDASVIRENVALVVADAQPSAPVRGLRIAARDSDMFNETAFKIIRDHINSSHLMADANEVVVQLPEFLATTNRRISFVVFRNDRAFQSSHGLFSVNSRILSVNIENTTQFDDGEFIDIYFTPTRDPQRDQSRSCAYWKFFDDDSKLGYWSQDGCTFIRANTDSMLDKCRCDHLTHFAEVLIQQTIFPERDEIALEIISIAGCCLSIFGLIFVGVTALMFRSWRRDYSNKIWLQLCISIFILSISFLVVLFANFETYVMLCMLTGIALHFSVLSSFCWMLVAAVLSYKKLVKVFTIDSSHKLLKASAFAWGVPCAVVGVLLSVAPHSYLSRFDKKNSTTAFCFPSGLAHWLSVFVPIALMLVVNWTLFALIVRSVLASRKNNPIRKVGNRHSDDRIEALRCASVCFFLVFLFGLPWFFGLFAMNLIMAYCFVLLSTFQGFILFMFLVLGNKNTRDLWLNKLKNKQNRKIPLTSSSYTNT